MRNRKQNGRSSASGIAGMCAIGNGATSAEPSNGSESHIILGRSRRAASARPPTSRTKPNVTWQPSTAAQFQRSGSSPLAILWSVFTCLGLSSTSGLPRRRDTGTSGKIILKPLLRAVWLKDTRTYHVQGWLNQIGSGKLSRNTLKHIKSVVSGIFTLAKQQDYFQAENPARDTAINPGPRSRKKRMPTRLRKSRPSSPCFPNPQQRVRGRSIHGAAARRDSRAAMGELPERRNVRFPLNLEWPGDGPKDSQGSRSRSGNSAVGGTAGIASAALRESANRPDLRKRAGKPLALGSVVNRVILPCSESL